MKDSSGGVLPGADVTVTQTETGFKRNVVTDAEWVVHDSRAFRSVRIASR